MQAVFACAVGCNAISLTSNLICGYGGIGRRVRFRFLWSQGCAGSSPVTRTRKNTSGHQTRGAFPFAGSLPTQNLLNLRRRFNSSQAHIPGLRDHPGFRLAAGYQVLLPARGKRSPGLSWGSFSLIQAYGLEPIKSPEEI